MAGPVTDPDLLAQLNAPAPQSAPKPVSDPSVLSQLNGGAPPAPDKYHQAAIDLQKKLQAAGVDTNEGLTGRYIRGRTLGAAGDITSILTAPLEMIRHGVGPVEGYRYAKAIDDVANHEGDDKTGIAGKVAEFGGGLQTGIGNANAGLTFLKQGMTLPQAIGAGMKEGATYGGVTGFFNGGDNLSDKFDAAGKGIALGGALGGATPVVGSVVSNIAAPVVSNIRARVSPEAFARSKLAEALANSGRSTQEIEQDLAGASSQPYVLADAMGNSGQRALSTVTRAPGPGRQEAVEFLDNRQAGQGRRIASALADGFDAPQTAQQTEAAMRAARSTEAAANYGAARQAAGAVDVSPAIKAADDVLQPGVNSLLSNSTNIADNSIAGAVQKAKSFLTDGKSQLSDFNQAHLAKQELDAMIEGASPTVQRNLIPIRNALDDALAASSKPYAAARNTFRDQSKAIDAIPQGRAAATRGRTEDTVPAFQKLSQDGQKAFRTGYVDPLIEQTQGGAMGVNKARPFTSDAYKTEFNSFAAPGRAQALADSLRRENTMFETRAHAVGGSRTADNLADEAGMRIDPGFVKALLSGHYVEAGRQAVNGISNTAKGLTPDVRSELGRMLLSGNGTAPQVVKQAVSERAKAQAVANALRSGVFAGSAELRAPFVKNR